MLSNQIAFQNKFIFFIDNYGIEKCAENVIRSILSQQNNLGATKFVKYNELSENLNEIKSEIVVLPLVSEILISNRPAFLFQLINKLKQYKNIKQIFIWATKQSLQQQFIIPFLEYMADQIITIKTSETLSILIRKTGGLVSNKLFTYKITSNGFEMEVVKTNASKIDTDKKLQTLGTFKIELEEEEMIARNALKLPFEKMKEIEGNIIYTPDDADDFDDEDPDEDLSI